MNRFRRPASPAELADRDAAAAAFRRRLFLSSLLIAAAQHRPGAPLDKLIDDACRAAGRFGPGEDRPEPHEFYAFVSMSLGSLVASR